VERVAAADCGRDSGFYPDGSCAPATPAAGAPQLSPARALSGPTIAAAHHPAPAAPRHVATRPVAPRGEWAIQVGAFKSPALARAVAEGARSQAPDELRLAALTFPPTAPFGGSVLYRARLGHLSASAASSACTRLNRRQLPCVVVRPTSS